MKNLSLSSIVSKNSIISTDAWLVAMKIHVRDPSTGAVAAFIRVINNSEVTTIDEDGTPEQYEPLPFSLSMREASNQLPAVSVTIQDQAMIVGGYMQRYGGGVGFEIELMVARAATATDTVIEPELIEYFQVIKSGYRDYVANWELGAENPLRRQFPLRKQDDNQCGFLYKGPDCGYSGSIPTCDRTLDGPNGCRVHANTPNYGAYPGIIVRG